MYVLPLPKLLYYTRNWHDNFWSYKTLPKNLKEYDGGHNGDEDDNAPFHCPQHGQVRRHVRPSGCHPNVDHNSQHAELFWSSTLVLMYLCTYVLITCTCMYSYMYLYVLKYLCTYHTYTLTCTIKATHLAHISTQNFEGFVDTNEVYYSQTNVTSLTDYTQSQRILHRCLHSLHHIAQTISVR